MTPALSAPPATPSTPPAHLGIATDAVGRPRPANARGLPPLEQLVGTDDVERALRDADRPLSARQIRVALDIPRAYLSAEVTRVLRAAVGSGRVVRTGNSVGTRYAAA